MQWLKEQRKKQVKSNASASQKRGLQVGEDKISDRLAESYLHIIRMVFDYCAHNEIETASLFTRHFLDSPLIFHHVIREIESGRYAPVDLSIASEEIFKYSSEDCLTAVWHHQIGSGISIAMLSDKIEYTLLHDTHSGTQYCNGKVENYLGFGYASPFLSYVLHRSICAGESGGRINKLQGKGVSSEPLATYSLLPSLYHPPTTQSDSSLSGRYSTATTETPLASLEDEQIPALLKKALSHFIAVVCLDKSDYQIGLEVIEDRLLEGDLTLQLHCEMSLTHNPSKPWTESLNFVSMGGNHQHIQWYNHLLLSYTFLYLLFDDTILVEGLLFPDIATGDPLETSTIRLNIIYLKEKMSPQKAIEEAATDNLGNLLDLAADKYRYFSQHSPHSCALKKRIGDTLSQGLQYAVECYQQAAQLVQREPFLDVMLAAMNVEYAENPTREVHWFRHDGELIINLINNNDRRRYHYNYDRGGFYDEQGTQLTTPDTLWRLLRHIVVYVTLTGVSHGAVGRDGSLNLASALDVD